MIDPTDVTDYNRSDIQLQEFILFSIAVAGKTAKIVAQQLENFLNENYRSAPFDKVRDLIATGQLRQALQRAKLGQYDKLTRAFVEIINVDLRKCTVDDLESIHGVGPKTARFFLIHSRPDIQVAALDTHILKFLKLQGYDVPDHTPTGKRYKVLEEAFIKEANLRNRPIAEFDLAIWNYYSRNGNNYLKNTPW